MNPAKSDKDRGIAIVLVHGIGDIAPGSVLRSAMREVGKHLHIAEVEAAPRRPARDGGEVRFANARLVWQDVAVEIIEFNWTGAIGKIRLLRPFDAIKKLLNVVAETPLIGVSSSSSTRLWRFARSASLFQYWYLVLLGVVVAGSTLEILLRPALADHVWSLTQEVLAAGDEGVEIQGLLPSTLSATSRDSPGVILVFASMGTFMGSRWLFEGGYVFSLASLGLYAVATLYYAVIAVGYIYFLPVRLLRGRKLTSVSTFWRTLVASSVVLSFLAVFVVQMPMYALAIATTFKHGGEDWLPGLSTATFWFYFGISALSTWLLLRPAVVIGNLLRDVVHYLAPGPTGAPQPHQERIRHELASLLERLGEEGWNRVILVAHSLGTVVVTDLLREQARAGSKATSLVFDLVTAGSPLRRLIYRLLPDRDGPRQLRQELAGNEAWRLGRWFNAYRLLDYVGQALTYSSLPLDLMLWRREPAEPQRDISDHLLKPRYKWPLAHANYWGDPKFLRFLTLNVIEPTLKGEALETRAS
jgi:hypothetical protein